MIPDPHPQPIALSFARLLLLALSSLIAMPIRSAAELFKEPWRPQFHFTPERNWMNDPNGMVYYEGEFHLFYQYNPFGDKWGHMSWGHAVSQNLVDWEHLPVALFEEDDIMIFSGSAVVDWNNTSGLGRDGKPPLVAIYTGHYTRKALQNQQIAYSNDRGRTWTRFKGNPVLDIQEADFRDPKVFWHPPTSRWIMTVAWPTHRKVRFYASPNLIDWTHLSDFGPAGSVAGIWECPDLFSLPIEFPSTENRNPQEGWVLIVNVGSGAPAGGSGCQYFIGDFDGHTFTLDSDFPKPVPAFIPPEGRLLADFEGDDYGDWVVTGNAFGSAPARGRIGDQQHVSGFLGRGFVNTFLNGDASQGTLTSPRFVITHDHISFLIGGGNHPGETCINLLINDLTVRSATGDNDERLSWKSWNVSEFRNQEARLEIMDRHTGGWGHINVDHILLSNEPARPGFTPALWADWGPDFYAAVSWSDVPKEDGRRLWLGWMGNWQYANDVPTAPWRSAMSIPRELRIRKIDEGLRLVQKPVDELTALRRRAHRWDQANAANLPGASIRFPGELLEIGATWDITEDTLPLGLRIVTGAEEATVIEYHNGTLTVDRTISGRVDFHPAFKSTYTAPLEPSDSRLNLRVFLDTSSIEVFANNGEIVLTSLILPTSGARTVEFFPPIENVDSRLRDWQVWELAPTNPTGSTQTK